MPLNPKLFYAPTVVIKGDFVGHPFRGNQWSDASGVSSGKRTTQQIIEQGPQRLAFGFDKEGLPRMASIDEARARYGSTAKEIRRYFRDTHNIKLEYESLIHDDEVAPVAALYGSLQALDDLLTNSKTVPESLTSGRRQGVGDISILAYDGSSAGTVQPYGNGTATLTLAPDTSAIEAGRLLAEGPDYGLRTTVTGTFGLENIVAPNPVFRTEGGRRLDETKLSPNDVALRAQISQRLAYAVAVHEWAHTLDVRQPDPKQRDVQGRYWRSDAIYGDNDGAPFPSRSGYESDALRMQLRTTAVTDYGTYDRQEFVAEAFAAWFLFARSTSAQGRALGDEARGALKPFLENTPMLKASAGIKIQELPFDHPVILFALAPLMVSNPQAFLKGDFVGHPFRGNQWSDSSGVSRGGASSGASDGDRLDLRGVATIDEARRTGRPLAMLQPETFSAANQAALQTYRQSVTVLADLLRDKTDDEQVALLTDPRYTAALLGTKLSHAMLRRGLEIEYAKALGFVEVTGDQIEEAFREKYNYEQVDRDPDGKLRREDETSYVKEIGGRRDAENNLSGPMVWRDQNGNLQVWLDGAVAPAEFVERYGANKTNDNMSIENLINPSTRILTYRTDSDESEIQNGPKAVALAQKYAFEQIRAVGINLPDPQPPVVLSAKPLIAKFRAEGISDPEGAVGLLIDHVQKVGYRASNQYANQMMPNMFIGTDIEGTEARQLARQIADVDPDVKVSVTVPTNRVGAILKDGRLKTLFETRTSGGANVTAWRENWEAVMFGYPIGTNPSIRPIYGMVETGGVQPSSLRNNDQYGTVTLVLKDDVKDRTTFTDGDSLNLNYRHAPVNNPSARLTSRFTSSIGREDRIEETRAADPSDRGYYEAQIHGGVKTSDIERVVIDTSRYKDYGQREVQPSPALLKALDKAGIPYEIVQGKPPDATKSAFAPTVLIKGDYVGHPFRGNQWTDASGVGSKHTGQGNVSDHQGGFAAGKKYERSRGPFRADPPSTEPFRDVTSPSGEWDGTSPTSRARDYETQAKPADPDRLITDRQARTIAADLMDKMDIVADAGAVIKIGEPTSEARAVYNDQLEAKVLFEQERPQQRTQVLNGINTTEAALNDEGTIVVITDRDNQIVGALSMQEKPVFGSSFSELSAFHAMSEVVQPSDKYVQMYAAGSTGRLDGVGSTLFGQAVLNASRQGAGLYLTPLNQTALEFWEKIGFKTVDAGQEFTKYQYLDAGSVKAIADNLDDPMETP